MKSLIMFVCLVGALLVGTNLLAQDAKLQRGKYLVEEIARCQECHTPKTDSGDFDTTKSLKGAKLNIAAGSDPTPVSSTITHADSLLSMFSGKLPYHVAPSSAIGQMMVSDGNTLDNYNNGLLTPGCSQRSARPAPPTRPAPPPR